MSSGTSPEERLIALDVFRGITIASMIIVNNPGSWKHVYGPLLHADWHGWTPTDLIFPFFLFIVGISISLALSRRKLQAAAWQPLYLKIMRRSLILFGLGLLLSLFPRFDISSLRIPGVLQRIAVCYLIASLLFLKTGWKSRVGIVLGLLTWYWLLMKFVPVPGYGAGIWEYEGNLCGWLDQKLLGGHLHKPAFDPEGVLSTLPAVATTLLGTLAGDWLRGQRSRSRTWLGLAGAGAALTVLGLWFHRFFPINKQLWTSSYVLFAAGMALLCFSLCYGIIDLKGIRRWSYPFRVLGTNAILVFVGSGLLARVLGLWHVSVGGERISVWSYIFRYLLEPWAGPQNGSLLFPLLLLVVWIMVLIPLYQKRIFIKI
jgi:predicted acyltransferase